MSAEDFDHEAKHQRERGASVGEELWHVHCKRAAGNLDQDYEDDEVPISTPEETKRAKDTPETPPKKSRSTDNSGEDEIKVIHHLRNRDIKIPWIFHSTKWAKKQKYIHTHDTSTSSNQKS